MTRDEQIAQLKPGAHVMMGDTFVSVSYLFLRHTKPFVECFTVGGTVRVFHEQELVLPDPPPAPKAVPGQVYRSSNVRGVGTLSGRVYTAGAGFLDFNPAVWTPVEEQA